MTVVLNRKNGSQGVIENVSYIHRRHDTVEICTEDGTTYDVGSECATWYCNIPDHESSAEAVECNTRQQQ